MSKIKCSLCGQVKEDSLFYKRKDRLSGFRSECKICTSSKGLEYRSKNLEIVQLRRNLWRSLNPDYDLIKNHGINAYQKMDIFIKQGGKCGICKKDFLPKLLQVDHDHSKGGENQIKRSHLSKEVKSETIRGLLCYDCNVFLMGLVDKVGYAEFLLMVKELPKYLKL